MGSKWMMREVKMSDLLKITLQVSPKFFWKSLTSYSSRSGYGSLPSASMRGLIHRLIQQFLCAGGGEFLMPGTEHTAVNKLM